KSYKVSPVWLFSYAWQFDKKSTPFWPEMNRAPRGARFIQSSCLPGSAFINEGFLALLLDGGQGHQYDQQQGQHQQRERQRAGHEGRVIATCQQQGTTEVFLHHGPQHQAEQQWRAFTFEFGPHIADCTERRRYPDVERVVVQRVDPD